MKFKMIIIIFLEELILMKEEIHIQIMSKTITNIPNNKHNNMNQLQYIKVKITNNFLHHNLNVVKLKIVNKI